MSTPPAKGPAPTPAPKLPRCFSIKQLVDHLSLSRTTISRAISTGELEHYRIGSRAVIPETAVLKWLEARRVTRNPVEHRRWMQKHFPQ